MAKTPLLLNDNSPSQHATGVPSPKPEYLKIDHLNLSLSGHPILKQISFSVPAPGMTYVIGPSGAGKSSLLRCLNLLHETWTGTIQVNGISIRDWPKGADNLRRHIGLIGQKPVVFPGSIQKNLLFGLSRREKRQLSRNRIQEKLEQVALWPEVRDRLEAPARELSLGQQQRLCIARALILEPALIMLDEPTSSLDSHSRQIVEKTLLMLAEKMAVLCVTHDLDQAKRLADQVIFLCEGRLIEKGRAESFFQQPQQIETREFLQWEVCDCDNNLSPNG
ncbi:MAG: hypothetical protein AXA67_00270 [Methylothermaceae bacteria B42]|nr:MAG: hypothetical protein AXA67_00270 [Methylothermaceae bacteria B42]HHJ38849.1 ATP-binding cassette domain-containing protein [Methylothermaceae bacterium]